RGPCAGDQLTTRNARGCMTSTSTTGCARSTSTAPRHTSSTSTSSRNADQSPDSTAAATDCGIRSTTWAGRRCRAFDDSATGCACAPLRPATIARLSAERPVRMFDLLMETVELGSVHGAELFACDAEVLGVATGGVSGTRGALLGLDTESFHFAKLSAGADEL